MDVEPGLCEPGAVVSTDGPAADDGDAEIRRELVKVHRGTTDWRMEFVFGGQMVLTTRGMLPWRQTL